MRNYVQQGDTLLVTAPESTDDDGGVSGDGVLVGDLFGVAATDFDAGGDVEIMVTGVFDLPKATPEVWAQGARLYWNNSTKRVTTTVGSNTLIGHATAAAGSTATVGRVRLNGAA
ncbi:MAG: capsid cement protein [Bauldia sp.]